MSDPAESNVQVFLSYSSEDDDIMSAFTKVFDRLSELSNAKITTIYDKKSFEPGAPIPLIREISDKLYRSDYLVMLYTGALRKSFNWTGTELGIFWGFIGSDERERGTTKRQIIVVYFDEKPPVDWGGLGIHLEISVAELQLPKDEFEKKVRSTIEAGQDQYQQLVNTLVGLGALADERCKPKVDDSVESRTQRANYVSKRSNAISDEIVPGLMGRLHEAIAKRVKRTRVEQRLIEFQIPRSVDASLDHVRLPDDAQLIEHGEAFALFTKNGLESPVSWKSFKSALDGNTEAAWITAAMERSVVSAVSPDLDRDDEQIIRTSEEGQIYRLIVTRRFEFYDGSAMAHMYIIPALRLGFLESSDAAVTLGFINVATKYRETFIDQSSDLSYLNYHMKPTFEQLVSKVERSVRQLMTIEDESHILKLEKWESIIKYFGVASEAEAKRVGEMNERWKSVRTALMGAAQVVIKTAPTAAEEEKEKAFEGWKTALREFAEKSEEINSLALKRAIENLKSYLSLDKPARAADPGNVRVVPAATVDGPGLARPPG